MKNRRLFSVVSTCAIVAASALWQGCAAVKTVTIDSTPDKATLTLFKVTQTGDKTIVPMDVQHSQTPMTVPLNFDDQVHYTVEAHRALCIPSLDTMISYDQQTKYDINLTQYKLYVAGIVNTPVKAGEIWQLKPQSVQTVASMDPVEPSGYYINQPVPITRNKSVDVDYPSLTASPVAATMVYEKISPDSSTSTGYSSKLFKLELQAGEGETQETMTRKQQRFPAFSFSGDTVAFDSNDDNRTDAPFFFKILENESSIGRLESIPDTLEYAFSIGKDNIAFAAYGPNSLEPQIEAAGSDGSGPTVRATGLSPQISPDGSQILFIHHPEAGGKYRICTVNTRGPIQQHEFPLNDDVDYFDPHWSPDGKMIVFCSPSRGKDLPDDNKKEPDVKYHDAEAEHSFIWIMSADGQHVLRLTRNESYDNNPVFDRNGRAIYFRSNRGGLWNIWKMDLTDNTFTELHVAPPAQ